MLRPLFELLRAGAYWRDFDEQLARSSLSDIQWFYLFRCALHLPLTYQHYHVLFAQWPYIHRHAIPSSRRGYSLSIDDIKALIANNEKIARHALSLMTNARPRSHADQLYVQADHAVSWSRLSYPCTITEADHYRPAFCEVFRHDQTAFEQRMVFNKAVRCVDEVSGVSTWISDDEMRDFVSRMDRHVLKEHVQLRLRKRSIAQLHFILRCCYVIPFIAEREDFWQVLELDPNLLSGSRYRNYYLRRGRPVCGPQPWIGRATKEQLKCMAPRQTAFCRAVILQHQFMAEKIIAMVIGLNGRWFHIGARRSTTQRFWRIMRRLPYELQVCVAELACDTEAPQWPREAAFQWLFQLSLAVRK